MPVALPLRIPSAGTGTSHTLNALVSLAAWEVGGLPHPWGQSAPVPSKSHLHKVFTQSPEKFGDRKLHLESLPSSEGLIVSRVDIHCYPYE